MPRFDEAHLLEAVSYLQAGGVLVYPSESVWGIGCDGFCEQALKKVLHLKSRPMDKGVIVLTDSLDKVKALIKDLPLDTQTQIITTITQYQQVYQLSDVKQATTWLIPIKRANIPTYITGKFDSLALRITPHPMLQSICKLLTSKQNPYGFLVSTSCNPSGQAPATSLEMAQAYFGEHVGYLQGEGLGFDKPSQIIDVLTGQVVR